MDRLAEIREHLAARPRGYDGFYGICSDWADLITQDVEWLLQQVSDLTDGAAYQAGQSRCTLGKNHD